VHLSCSFVRFKVSYPCSIVVRTVNDECRSMGEVNLRAVAGYLKSSIDATNVCPWTMEAEPGQRIRVTLFNFRLHETASSRPVLG